VNVGADLDRGFTARAYHVYRASDGAIVLTHTFVRHADARDNWGATERDLLAEASRSSGLERSKLRIVSRDGAYPPGRRILRVNPKTKKLVTTDEPWPGLPQRGSSRPAAAAVRRRRRG
jgi:hypothetical protein